jgi:hypothetical protein
VCGLLLLWFYMFWQSFSPSTVATVDETKGVTTPATTMYMLGQRDNRRGDGGLTAVLVVPVACSGFDV